MERHTFKALFDRYYRPLCHFAFKITGDSTLAEDLVQEVFLNIWNKQIIPDENRDIGSLLFKATRNKALEYFRKSAARDKMHENIRFLNPVQTDEISEDEIEKYLLIERIYMCIRQLPPKCGEVFTLSKVDGLSYALISEKLDISVKTVENHMNKAFKLIRGMISEINIKSE